jgi:hypothetical protein
MARAKSFTMGTKEMLSAVLDAHIADGDDYAMRLNVGDLEAVTFALATSVGFVSWDDASVELRDRATSLFSGIAGTLGIEGI